MAGCEITANSLGSMSRKELQAIAKEHGLKANKANVDLIKEILEIITSTKPTVVPNVSDEMETVVTSIAEELIPDKPWENGDAVDVTSTGCTQRGLILRLNKKSARVQLESGDEITVKFEEMFRPTASMSTNGQQPETTSVEPEPQAVSTEYIEVMMTRENHETIQSADIFLSPKISEAAEMGPFSATNFMFSPRSAKKVSLSTRFLSMGTPRTTEKPMLTPGSLKKPKLVPSSTKSQILRTEASLLKKRNYEEIEKQAQQEVTEFLSVALPSKRPNTAPESCSKVPVGVSVRLNRAKSPAKVTPKCAFPMAYKAKPAPNFNEVHSKQFSGFKPITNIVPRDKELDKRMESALQKAKVVPFVPSDAKTAFTLGPYNHKENIPKKFIKEREQEASKKHFKAKPMPNFNAIHGNLVRNAKPSMSTSFSSTGNHFSKPQNLVSTKGSFHR